MGADYGLLHVLLPVPVVLDTYLCLPPSPTSFPDTRHHHWAKPWELFEMVPCAQLRIAPSWAAPSRQPCQGGWAGKMDFLCYQGSHTLARQPCETMPLFTL